MIRIKIRYEIVRGVDDSSVSHELIKPLLVQREILSFEREKSRVNIHVIIKVHPKELITIKTMLVSFPPIPCTFSGARRSMAGSALRITVEINAYLLCVRDF